MVVTRKQTNSLPPPRFRVRQVADEEADEARDGSDDEDFEADVRVDEEEVKKFLFKLGWRLRESDAKYVKKGLGGKYKHLLKIPADKGRVPDFLFAPKNRVPPRKALLEKYRKEKHYHDQVKRRFGAIQLRLQVEHYTLTQELLQIETGGQTKRAEEIVEVKLDDPNSSSATDGWVFQCGDEASDDAHNFDNMEEEDVKLDVGVVEALKRASRADWTAETSHIDPGPSTSRGCLPDIDMSVPGPSRRYVSSEEDDDDDDEENEDGEAEENDQVEMSEVNSGSDSYDDEFDDD